MRLNWAKTAQNKEKSPVFRVFFKGRQGEIRLNAQNITNKRSRQTALPFL